MPTIRWPAPPDPTSSVSDSGSDLSARSRRRCALLTGQDHGLSGTMRLRLFREGAKVWERELRPTEPRPERAWVHDTGVAALIGEWSRGKWLSFLDPRTGNLWRVVELRSVLPPGADPGLRFSTAGFVDLPRRGICFSLRTAQGPRVLLDPYSGAFVPDAEQEAALAAREAEEALEALAELEGSNGLEAFRRPPASQERLGAATLVAVEQGLPEATCALRALEWGGGPCRPGLRRPGDVNPALADLFDLRRLAQRALLRLGAVPRPLPGARVIRIGPKAALHTSLAERAAALWALCGPCFTRLTPTEVLAEAGQPDDVGPAHWDYGVYEGQPVTLRFSWSRPAWGQVPRLERISELPVWAATSSYRGLEGPLDPLAA